MSDLGIASASELSALADDVITALADKVDKVEGKGLSTNDYTDADKTIVGGVTAALAGKVDKVSGKGLSTNDFTDAYKTAVDANTTAIEGIKNGEEINSFGGVEGALSDVDNSIEAIDSKIDDSTTYPYADVITIPDAIPANVADCNVKIEPVQDLHGYDKPWVGGAGKNLGVTIPSKTHNDVVFTANTDGSLSVKGLASGYAFTDSIFTLKMGSYYISHGVANLDSNVSLILRNNTTDAYIVTASDTGVLFTLAEDTEVKFRCAVAQGYNADVKIYPMIRLATEADATFAPYTNICPITGHTEASVQRVGRNRCDTASFTSTPSDRIVNLNGVKAKAGTYTASFDVDILPSIDYRIEFSACSVATQTQGTTVAAYITGAVLTANSTGRKSVSLTVDTDCWLYIRCIPSGFGLSKIQIENGDTAHDYEPFKGKTYTILFKDAQGQTITVCGSDLDVKNGTLKVGRADISISGGFNKVTSQEFDYSLGTKGKAFGLLTCDRCIRGTSASAITPFVVFLNQNGDLVVRTYEEYSTTGDFLTAIGGSVQVVYELATPFTIQLTPQQIQLLKGQNTLTASTGDISVTVNGVSGAIGQVQEQVNELVPLNYSTEEQKTGQKWIDGKDIYFKTFRTTSSFTVTTDWTSTGLEIQGANLIINGVFIRNTSLGPIPCDYNLENDTVRVSYRSTLTCNDGYTIPVYYTKE